MTRKTQRALTVGVLGMAMLVGGCGTFGNPLDAIRAKKAAPDAFQVVARKDLRMPGTLRPATLPVPRPGESSPLEPNPQADAINALTGRQSIVTEMPSTNVSRGETLLLSAVEAQPEPEIRAQLTRENAERATNEPYEPPSILELVAGRTETVDPETVVDGTAEAKRLQAAGVRTPFDPNAVAEVEREQPQGVTSYYDSTRNRGPVRNRLPSDTTEAPDTPTLGGSF
jgi:hypothetical protein